MKARAVVPRVQANRDVDDAIAHYLGEHIPLHTSQRPLKATMAATRQVLDSQGVLAVMLLSSELPCQRVTY